MDEFPLIPIAIWGLIQAFFVFAIDQKPRPAVLWFLIFVGVSSASFGVMHLTFVVKMWMLRKLMEVPIYRRWLVMRHEQRKPGTVNPLHGIFLGLMAGPLVGPIFAFGIAHIWWPRATAFRAACVGMVVGIVLLSTAGVIMFAVGNISVRRRKTNIQAHR